MRYLIVKLWIWLPIDTVNLIEGSQFYSMLSLNKVHLRPSIQSSDWLNFHDVSELSPFQCFDPARRFNCCRKRHQSLLRYSSTFTLPHNSMSHINWVIDLISGIRILLFDEDQNGCWSYLRDFLPLRTNPTTARQVSAHHITPYCLYFVISTPATCFSSAPWNHYYLNQHIITLAPRFSTPNASSIIDLIIIVWFHHLALSSEIVIYSLRFAKLLLLFLAFCKSFLHSQFASHEDWYSAHGCLCSLAVYTCPTASAKENLRGISRQLFLHPPSTFSSFEHTSTLTFSEGNLRIRVRFIKPPISVATRLNLPVNHFNTIWLVSLLRVRLRCLIVKFSGEKQDLNAGKDWNRIPVACLNTWMGFLPPLRDHPSCPG